MEIRALRLDKYLKLTMIIESEFIAHSTLNFLFGWVLATAFAVYIHMANGNSRYTDVSYATLTRECDAALSA